MYITFFFQEFCFHRILVPGTCYAIELRFADEQVLKNGDIVNATYFITIKRVLKPKSDNDPLEFVPTYLDNEQTGAGIYLGVNTFARLYRAFFLEASLHREGKSMQTISNQSY